MTSRTFTEEYREFVASEEYRSLPYLGGKLGGFFKKRGWVPASYAWFWLAFFVELFALLPVSYMAQYEGLSPLWIAAIFGVMLITSLASEWYLLRYSKLAFAFGLIPTIFIAVMIGIVLMSIWR